MASNLPTITFAVLPLILASLAFADTKPSTFVSPRSLCQSTPHPSYCNSAVPPQNGTVYDYGLFSVRKSLLQAHRFLNLVDKYLQRRSSLSAATVGALEDCRLLAELTLDYLSTSFETVNTTRKFLPSFQAHSIQTSLSATLTNQQTCLDGLQEAASSGSVGNGLSAPLSDDSKIYSVSLALFTKGWVPRTQKKQKTQHPPTNNQPKFPNCHLSIANNQTTIDGCPVKGVVTVSQDGTGNFTTINDAVSAAPNKTSPWEGYFIIYITAGVYEEYVCIDKRKTNLMMVGAGINKTIITGNRSKVDTWKTFNSATFAVLGSRFVARNITFSNTAGPEKHQAVAVLNNADLSVFYCCSFEGYQDTFYTHAHRQFYRECDIYGTVDFIFGNSAVVFQNCNIYPRQPLLGQYNAITAQGRTVPDQTTGISIHNCTIRPAGDLAANLSGVATYLGRPWKNLSRTVYMQSVMDSVIDVAGWHAWNDSDFALDTLYYAEFNNSGPGSSTAQRVTWFGYHVINAAEAANFTVSNFLLGDYWLPYTGVPYTSDLN